MDNYLVITKIDGKTYLTSVKSSSLLGAAMACCVVASLPSLDVTVQAFDAVLMRTGSFADLAIEAETVSLKELKRIAKAHKKLMEGR